MEIPNRHYDLYGPATAAQALKHLLRVCLLATALLCWFPTVSRALDHYDFNYPDRASLIANGWGFVGVGSGGVARNTEQETGAVVSYDQTLHPGTLRIPVDSGDLWAQQNNTRNSLFRPLPQNWTSVRLKFSFAPTASYQQAGLVAYQDDDNYVVLTRIYAWGQYVTFARESGGAAAVINSIPEAATQHLVFRLDRDPLTEEIKGFYSLDETTWIPTGSAVQGLINPRVAIVAGASPAGLPNADISWVEVLADGPASTEKLTAFPADVLFTQVQGSTGASKTVELVTSNDVPLQWSHSVDVPWLKVTPDVGATPGTITLSADSSGLSPGTYAGTLTVYAPMAVNSPRTVKVALVVNPRIPVQATPWKDGRSGALSVSVDDGYPSCFDQLSRNGFTGTYFSNGTVAPFFFPTFYQAGMELGAHLTDHPCNAMTAEALRSQEIEPNIQGICNVIPGSCAELISLAWPCGYTNTIEESVAAEYFLSARGYNDNLLEDITPGDFHNMKNFNSHEHVPYPPNDLKTVVDLAVQQGKWANMVFHSSCDDNGAIDYAAGKDIWVAPIGRIVKYIQQRDRLLLADYQESPDKLQFSISRLPLPSTPVRSFESAIGPSDLVTLRVDVDDAKRVSRVLVHGVEVPFQTIPLDGNKVLLLNTALHTQPDTVEIDYLLSDNPVIEVSPTALAFSATQGSTPPPQSLKIMNKGAGTLTWSVVPEAPPQGAPQWLGVAQPSGVGDGTLTVTVSTAGLQPGSYTRTLTITAAGADNSPQQVPISLTVYPSGTAHYTFDYPDRTALLADGWNFLALAPSGSARDTEQLAGAVPSYDQTAHPGVLRIPCDRGDLWEGLNDTRNSLFRDLPADWTSIRLKLSFAPTINYQQAGILAYQDDDNYVQLTRIHEWGDYVTFAREQHAAGEIVAAHAESASNNLLLRLDRDPATERISSFYSLDGTNWTAVGSVVQPLSHPRLAIVIGASPAGFPKADLAYAEVIAAGASSISVSRSSVSFSTLQGSDPAPQTVTLQQTGTVPLNWSASVDTGPPAWLSVTPASGTGNGTLNLSASASSLAPGIYTKNVTVSAPGAANSPQTIQAALTVTAAGTQHINFSYADRAALLADGWDFRAITGAGNGRDTEQTSGATVNYDQSAHPGVLRIPADAGDLWEGINNTRNTLFRNLPSGWGSVVMKLDFAPSFNYQQAGLLAYQDDDNYVQVTRMYGNLQRVTLARESSGAAEVVNSIAETATSLYLKLSRNAATQEITASYSVNGTAWTTLGTVTKALNNPRLAIVVGASSGGFPPADLSWVEISSTP